MKDQQSGSEVRQHKNMAQGKEIPDQGNFGVGKINGGASGAGHSGDFGCGSFAECFSGKAHPDAKMDSAKMGERAVGDHVSRGKGSMPGMANSDHGPHHW